MLKTGVQFPARPPFLCIPLIFLLFIVMDNHIELLEEISALLYEIFNNADDSVADFKLDLQIAYNFVSKALDTEDRLDIFRALQKVHGVLETDGEEPVGGDLIDRIKMAMEGLKEQRKMDKSQIKEMVREVIKEIYQREQMPKDSLGLLYKLSKMEIEKDPRLNNPTKGQFIANASLNTAIEDFKNIIRGCIDKNPEIISQSDNFYTKEMSGLIRFIEIWGSNIIEADFKKQEEVLKIIKDIKDHAIQVSNQGWLVFKNMKEWENYINAKRQIEHTKEIFGSLRESINELFELSKRYQYEE